MNNALPESIIKSLNDLEVEDDGSVISQKKLSNNIVNEGYGSSPLEDRYGRHLWSRTRMCFCDYNSPTDCRFHNEKEPGWETCPNTDLAIKGKKLGRWLWARNPLYGKPLTDQESLELAAKLALNTNQEVLSNKVLEI